VRRLRARARASASARSRTRSRASESARERERLGLRNETNKRVYIIREMRFSKTTNSEGRNGCF
jgi:hypothetical protein